METTSKRHLFLKALACLGQFAALFPFAVLFETLCSEKFVVWHFFVFYVVWIVFRSAGQLIGKLFSTLHKRKLPKILIPLMNFLFKMGFVIPMGAFIALGIWLKLDLSVYFYILPAGIIIYFGGNLSVGRSYSDIFSKAWFLLYLISAVFSMLIISVSEKSELSSAAGYMLCVGFAVVILFSALLANQKNIDTRTNQRDAGKAVLPEGLRRYNALLVIGIFTSTLGLFVFAKPIAGMIKVVIKAVIAFFVYLSEKFSDIFPEVNGPLPPSENVGVDPIVRNSENDGFFLKIIFAVIIIAVIVLIIVFRKQIFRCIKSLFEPRFRSRDKTFDMPFADEITSSDAKLLTPKAQKKAERDLARQYARETSPERKYRLGYALFLARLRRTEQPPVPSDTTDIHREKGEQAFGEDLRDFTETYNKVRYADRPPTAEELAAESELLRKIK